MDFRAHDCVTDSAKSLDFSAPSTHFGSHSMTENQEKNIPDSDDTVASSASESATPADQEDRSIPSNDRAIRPLGVGEARKLAAAAARVAIDNNGQDVAVLDVSAQSAEFDFFVFATGTSRRQLHAISEQIDDVLEKDLGDKRMGIEGYEESRWIVLDYGSVVIHLFDDETREYYDLESLWADGTIVSLEELGLSQNPS
ncbi:ribosome silencing factor [Rhodopirellula sp.]|nr:ribosome silencing factor [Rhodopirellula sp.]